jgi:hypothetical protein
MVNRLDRLAYRAQINLERRQRSMFKAAFCRQHGLSTAHLETYPPEACLL